MRKRRVPIGRSPVQQIIQWKHSRHKCVKYVYIAILYAIWFCPMSTIIFVSKLKYNPREQISFIATSRIKFNIGNYCSAPIQLVEIFVLPFTTRMLNSQVLDVQREKRNKIRTYIIRLASGQFDKCLFQVQSRWSSQCTLPCDVRPYIQDRPIPERQTAH